MIIIFITLGTLFSTQASSIYKISKSDLRAANNIDTLSKLFENDNYNTHIISKTHQSIKNSKSFKPYLSWIEKIKNINKSKYPKTLSFCKKENFSNPLGSYLNSFSQKICDYKITYQLRVLKDPTQNEQYIKDHLDRLKTRKYFLNNLYQIERKNIKIKEVVEQFIIKSKKYSFDLIKNHNSGQKLTDHLQRSDFSKQFNAYLEGYSLKQQVNNFFTKYDNLNSQYKVELTDLVDYAHKNNSFSKEATAKKLNFLGKFLMRRKEYTFSRKIFLDLSKNKNQTIREKAQFNFLWSYIDDLDYSNGLSEFFKKFPKFDIKSTESDRLKFWLTFSLYSENKKKKSIPLFKHLIKNSPLSYYSIISSKLLRRELDAKKYALFINKYYKPYINVVSILPTHLSKQAQFTYKRINLWSKINQSGFLGAEINNLLVNIDTISSKQNLKGLVKQDAVLLISEILNNSNQHIQAFSNLYRAISSKTVELNTYVLKKLFPLPKYTNFIFNFKDIDPVIVISLIRQESGFNANAVSPVGARGLMQLMPRTARRFNRKIRIKDLKNPKKNIKIGVTYLKHLINKYDDNLVFALSAYNAGEGRVDRWKQKFFDHDSILHSIENIPFDETKKYVKLIFRNIFFYKLIKEKKMLKDGFSMNKFFDISLGFKH